MPQCSNPLLFYWSSVKEKDHPDIHQNGPGRKWNFGIAKI